MIATLTHPGPAPARRQTVQPCRAQPVDLLLPVADTLAQSVALALAGFDGGWLVIGDAPMAALDFVIPGTDSTGAHAAWYAGPHRMGAGRIRHLGLHAGRKAGAPWLHGHGAFAAQDWSGQGWAGPDFGHILPLESRLAAPVRARGWGLTGAGLAVEADGETGFPLFQPVDRGGGPGAALITLRPNQDITLGLEQAAAGAGITTGRVLGLGSLVHPVLEGQPPIDSLATEILLTGGNLTDGRARLEAELITLSGTRHRGTLARGANGVCITAELLLLADQPISAA